MQVEIRAFINSGILETYVMGIATEDEVEQVLTYKEQYPEVADAIHQIELEAEAFAMKYGIEPPAGTLEKIEDRLHEIQFRGRTLPSVVDFDEIPKSNFEAKSPYIEVESSSSHMRIHKAWRWVFAAVFVLGKVFLGFAIYYYLSNRQAQQQIEELKLEMRQYKRP